MPDTVLPAYLDPTASGEAVLRALCQRYGKLSLGGATLHWDNAPETPPALRGLVWNMPTERLNAEALRRDVASYIARATRDWRHEQDETDRLEREELGAIDLDDQYAAIREGRFR